MSLMNRDRVFLRRAPREWKPRVGEQVIVRRIEGTLSTMTPYGTIVEIGPQEGVALVRVEFGWAAEAELWHLWDLRPKFMLMYLPSTS